mgnify:CR=1 FL=1
MNKKILRAIEISRALRPQKQSGKNFHCSFGFLRSKIVGIGWNSYDESHLEHKFGKYHPTRGGENYNAGRHSETQLLRRLKISTKDLTIINVRVGYKGEILMARCCLNCERVLREKGFKKLLYTITETEFGVLE